MNPRVVIAVAALGLFAVSARPVERAEGSSPVCFAASCQRDG
jgi:hypothetical protein